MTRSLYQVPYFELTCAPKRAPRRAKQLSTVVILLYRFMSCWCLETFLVCSISLAVYHLSLPYHREHYANMGKNDTLFKDQEPQKLYPIPRQYLYSPYMGVLLRAPPSRLHANDWKKKQTDPQPVLLGDFLIRKNTELIFSKPRRKL